MKLFILQRLFITIAMLFLFGCGSNNPQSSDWTAPRLKIQKANSNTISEFKKGEVYVLDDQIKFDPANEIASIFVDSKCLAEGRVFDSKYFVQNQNILTIKSLVPGAVLALEINETICNFIVTVKNLSGSQKLYNLSDVKIIPQDFKIEYLARTEPMPEHSHSLKIFEVQITNFLSTPQTLKIPNQNSIRYRVVLLNEGGFALFTKPITVPLQFDFQNLNVTVEEAEAILHIPPFATQIFNIYVPYTSTTCTVRRDRLVGFEFEFTKGPSNYNFIKNTGTSRLPFFIPFDTINNITTVENVTRLGSSGEVLCL